MSKQPKWREDMKTMGFFDRILGYKKSQTNKEPVNENALKMLELNNFIDSLVKSDKYIAKSEYFQKMEEYKTVVEFFHVLKSSGMLEDFCRRNGISLAEVQNAVEASADMDKLMDQHNEEFIATAMIREKEYLDNILKAVDPVVLLDDDQRRVVLTDEDYCLVIAGAGAGKTTTVAAKVKYLVDRQGVKPSQILVVSFTNKAVNELKEKI